MKKIITLSLFFLFLTSSLSAQMWNGVDTLYGNEWINYSQSYYKILVPKDSIYRISHQALVDNGIPVSAFQGNQIRLYHLGKEVPIHVSSNNTLTNNDYIEFYGKRNRSELDEYLFLNPTDEIANTEYSLFTDSSAYFLTWENSPSSTRFENIPNNLNSAPASAESYCYHFKEKIFNSDFSKQKPSGLYHSQFEVAEGFVSSSQLSQTVTIEPENVFTGGPDSKVFTRSVVTNFTNENVVHEQAVSINGNLVDTENFNHAKVIANEFDIATTSIGSSVEVKFEGLYNSNDRQNVAYVKLKYPRTFDFSNKNYFEFLMAESANTQLLEISNFNGGGSSVLYDVTNNLRIEATLSGSNLKIALPPSPTERKLILVNTNDAPQVINTITDASFVDLSSDDSQFIIISDRSLSSNQSGTNWVEEYANYRRNYTPRSYTSKVIDIQQLYDQFGYGINRHSHSIRNFGHFIKKEWSSPEYIFLIGKGRTYEEIRTKEDLDEAIADNTFHIPTFGTRGGGDNLLLSKNSTGFPIIPIGRIAARTPDDVKLYLDKIIAQESNQTKPQTIEDRAWRKRILHLGGGNTQEQPAFKAHLGSFESIIENSLFGAEVMSFYKTTSDPIQISTSEQLTNIINEGVSVMSIFGHASSSGFDFAIDDASTYDNEGRFPVMFSFGCFSGAIHLGSKGVSEDFVLTPNKGAIAFFASTDLSLPSGLRAYGDSFYSQMGLNKYGAGLGDMAKAALESTHLQIGYLAGIMTLHGDPSIRVNVGNGPDYLINGTSATFNPNPISIQQDSFDFSFELVNIGQRRNDKMLLEIVQQFPTGVQVTLVADSIQAPTFKEILTYKLPTLGNDALGENKFLVTVDKGNRILESPNPSAEQNNTLTSSLGDEGINVHFISNEVTPVFPKEYSIVNNPNITLKASTASTFLDAQKYIFQIDTTNLFNSPFLKSKEFSQVGGVVKWKPEISFQNDVVYYWRVSPEEDPDVGGFIWKESSFLYKPGLSNGWNQSHYFQYQKDFYSNIILEENREFQYIKDFKDVRIEQLAIRPQRQAKNFINNDFSSWYWGSPPSAVSIIILDSINVDPWLNPPGSPYGELSYYPGNLKNFPFDVSTTAKRENVINFLDNVVPDGNYVIFLTGQTNESSYFPEQWAADSLTLGRSLFNVLEEQGATQVRNLETIGAVPYAYIYQKGVGIVQERIAQTIDEDLLFTFSIAGNWDEGYVESTPIGPARTWESLQWQTSSIDNIPTDNFYLDVYGIDANGQDSLLYPNISANDTSLNQINAEEFPYIKLRLNTQDTIQKTTIQLDYWRVFFEGLPEVALNPDLYFSFGADTIEQGEIIDLGIAIENIGQYDMDSLLVKFSVTDQFNNKDTLLKRLAPLLEGDSLIATLKFDTKDLSGKNSLQIEANPNKDQAEEYHFNNIGFFDFFVKSDKRNPLLDVTFDGFHIMDGDLVSSKPEIVISLKDENPFLALDDTSLIKLYLQSPNDPEVRQIFIDADSLVFFPSNGSSSNKAQLIFTPHLLVDGTYFLIVQAQDKTGNQSGNFDYKVSFEIKNKSSITNVLNYPNPFSTSTKFVFTITGDQIPENMKIQIMTISGKIVKEITQAELGPIHVGNNITEYAWNGTDDFGDKLANGVYLYRVVTRKAGGESFEKLNTKSDQFFKNGFGKMVILR